MRDANGGSPGRDGDWGKNERRRLHAWSGWHRGNRCKRRTCAKPGAIDAVGSRAFFRIGVMVMMVAGAIGFVSGAMLEYFAVFTELNVRVSEYRRQRIQHERNPDDKQLPWHRHQAAGSIAREFVSPPCRSNHRRNGYAIPFPLLSTIVRCPHQTAWTLIFCRC